MRSPGRGRGTRTAPVVFAAPTGRGLMAKIGAGCGPGCKYKALANTAVTPPTRKHIAIASRGRVPNTRDTKERTMLAPSDSASPE